MWVQKFDNAQNRLKRERAFKRNASCSLTYAIGDNDSFSKFALKIIWGRHRSE